MLAGVTIYSLQVIKYLFETLSFNAKFGMYQLKLKLAEPRCIKLSSDIIKVRQIRNVFFQADVSSKKRTNKFNFTTCRLVFVRFLEESEDTEKTF